MRARLSASIVSVTLMFVSQLVGASGIDLHWLWDDRCATCHGHAGDFARKFLNASGDELQGRHHVHDLHRFMHNHYLAGNEVYAVYNMLLAQVNSPAKFKNECSGCHETAAKFVRNTLALRDGVLYSRVSGQAIRGFLEHHRSLEPKDVDFFMKLLTRVAGEVYRP